MPPLVPENYWQQELERRGGRYVRDMSKDGSNLQVWRFREGNDSCVVTVPYVTDPYNPDHSERYVVAWVLHDILANLP